MTMPLVFSRHIRAATYVLLLLATQCEAQTKAPSSRRAPASAAAPPDERLLLGRWQSVADPGFTLRITPTAYIESYPNVPPATLHYLLGTSCRCDEAAAVQAPTRRLLVTFETSVADCYCYSIDQLDARRLVLLYIGRGNKLTFERMK